MTLIQVIILGLVQGLTEFIPVSSSGHLYLLPALFDWTQPSTTMVLFAHFGTLLALIAYFRRDLWEYLVVGYKWIRRQPQPKSGKARKQQSDTLFTLRNVIIATIPAGIVGVVVNKFLIDFYDTDQYGTVPVVVTLVTMAALGVVFILTDKMFTGKKIDMSDLGWKKPIFVGTSQALAFIRGTSRSGVTLITGQMVGLNRVNAAKYSFLMSIPLIAAAAVLSLVDFIQLPPEQLQLELPGAIIILITSAFSGYFAIRYMLGYLERAGLKVFGWYRILLALAAGLLLFTT